MFHAKTAKDQRAKSSFYGRLSLRILGAFAVKKNPLIHPTKSMPSTFGFQVKDHSTGRVAGLLGGSKSRFLLAHTLGTEDSVRDRFRFGQLLGLNHVKTWLSLGSH
jgi:hypothetical protein